MECKTAQLCFDLHGVFVHVLVVLITLMEKSMANLQFVAAIEYFTFSLFHLDPELLLHSFLLIPHKKETAKTQNSAVISITIELLRAEVLREE